MKAQAYLLVVGLTSLLLAGPARGQSSANESGASKAAVRFQQAVELYREGSYEGALAEFRKAYQLSPSYRVLYNIAQTQFALHDFVGAYKSLKQYVAEGGSDITADRRAQVDDMSTKLSERIAYLEIRTNVSDADIRVDDVSVGKSPLPETVLVNVGSRKVSAFKAGSPEAVRMVTVAGKEILRVDLRVDEPSALPLSRTQTAPRSPLVVKTEAAHGPPSRVGLIVSLSTTAALAVGTGVFGYLALRAQNDFKNELNTYPNTRQSIEDARTKSKNYGYLTDAFGAATLLSGGIATYFFVTTNTSSQAAKAGKATVVGLAPTLGGMQLQGSF